MSGFIYRPSESFLGVILKTASILAIAIHTELSARYRPAHILAKADVYLSLTSSEQTLLTCDPIHTQRYWGILHQRLLVWLGNAPV